MSVELGEFDLMALFAECMVGVPANIQTEVRAKNGTQLSQRSGSSSSRPAYRTLPKAETAVLKAFAAGAAGGLYGDTLLRSEAKMPDLPINLSNIKMRATAWGLVSSGDLKEQCNVMWWKTVRKTETYHYQEHRFFKRRGARCRRTAARVPRATSNGWPVACSPRTRRRRWKHDHSPRLPCFKATGPLPLPTLSSSGGASRRSLDRRGWKELCNRDDTLRLLRLGGAARSGGGLRAISRWP